MSSNTDVRFIDFELGYRSECLNLFDLNCPEYFAANERDDYDQYLLAQPIGYELLEVEARIVGAFGISVESSGIGKLHWILLDPSVQGLGLGRTMMNRVEDLAQGLALSQIEIAASHLSAPFFEKFGAKVVQRMDEGWGIGMHREDMVLNL